MIIVMLRMVEKFMIRFMIIMCDDYDNGENSDRVIIRMGVMVMMIVMIIMAIMMVMKRCR